MLVGYFQVSIKFNIALDDPSGQINLFEEKYHGGERYFLSKDQQALMAMDSND